MWEQQSFHGTSLICKSLNRWPATPSKPVSVVHRTDSPSVQLTGEAAIQFSIATKKCTNPLREIQRHHTKRSTGNPRFVADLVDWAGVKKAFLEEAKGKINQNHADLLSLGAYLFVESIGKGPW